MNFSTSANIQQRGARLTGWWFVLLLLVVSTRAFGANAPYVHFGFTTNWPAIDAPLFDNRGTFRDIMTTFPADTTDTLTFLNRGEMTGQVGFRFDTVTSTTRKSALSFTNFEGGLISGLDNPAAYWGFLQGFPGGFILAPAIPVSPASYCLVNSTNIANRGVMKVGNVGLMRLNGRDVDLTRGTLAAGDVSDFNTNLLFNALSFSNLFGFNNFFSFFNNAGDGSALGLGLNFGGFGYLNPPHVYDLFWGEGGSTFTPSAILSTNDNGSGLQLQTGQDPVEGRPTLSAVLPLTVAFPLRGDSQFTAKAYEAVDGSNYFFNVVFVNTNSLDGAVNFDVGFNPDTNTFGFFTFFTNNSFESPDCIVQCGVTNVFDVTTGQTVTNAIYLIDHGAKSFGFVASNFAVLQFSQFGRPDTFEITTVMPPEWATRDTNAFDGVKGNIPYDPSILRSGLFDFSFLNQPIAIYGAQVGRNPETINGLTVETNSIPRQFNSVLRLPEATNDVPRIEITATNLELSSAKIRSEGMIQINAKNLANAALAAVDAGLLNGNIGSTNGSLMFSNVVPPTFRRVRGNIYAWSATYAGIQFFPGFFTNFVTTHVLIVDQALRGSFTPTFQNLTLHGPQTVIQDNIRVNRSLLLDADSLTINSTVHLAESMEDFRRANAPHLTDLLIDTNGAFIVDNTAFIGWDTRSGLNTFINHGLVASPGVLVKANYVQNTGTINGTNGGTVIIQGGTVDLLPEPAPTFAAVNTIVADRDVEIDASTVNAVKSTIIAGANGTLGTLTLNVNDTLTDFVPNFSGTNNVLTNYWQANNGVIVPSRANGDLFGTEIVVIATNRNQAQVVWPGEDVGAGSDGFANNLVVGHLVLDRTDAGSSIRFSAAGDRNAIYVDYLELRDFSFSDYRNNLFVDPNMTIYFAASNFEPQKLMAVYPDRLVWVQDFRGPNSTKAVPRSDGSTCLMNTSEANSQIIDSDGDGIPNGFDPFPLDNDAAGVHVGCPGDTVSAFHRTFFAQGDGKSVTSLDISVTGNGKVTPQPHSGMVSIGNTYTFNAVPKPGNLFAGWTGDITTMQPKITFTMLSNMVLNARFVQNPYPALRGGFNGLFYDTNGVTMDSSGAFVLVLNQAGGFSGRLITPGGVVPFGGQFDANGNATVVAPRARKSPLTLTLNVDSSSQQVTGTIKNDTNWTANVLADKAVFGGRNIAPYAGNYNFAWSGDSNDPTNHPGGDTYGTVLINRAGMLVGVTRFADGYTTTQPVPISKDGNWPFFTTLFGKEMAIGWVHVDTNKVLSGTITWIKQPMPIGFYRAGFTNTVSLVGSGWVAPKDHTTGLQLTTPVLTLSGGNLDSALSPAVTLNPINLTFSSTNPTLSMRMIPSIGLFTGRFTDPATARVRTFSGVMLQNQNNARGYFLGSDQSGAVRLDNP